MLEGLESRNESSARRARQLQPGRFVTCGAFHGFVSAGERVVRLRMVETGGRRPMLDVVALEAILLESAAMRVDVARGAAPLEPEPAGVRWRPLRMANDRRDAQRRLVTGRAALPLVTAFERPSGTRMFEPLDRSSLAFPAHQCEIDAGVLRMAARAA